MVQCNRCGRKANRQCPKLKGEICSRCCGNNRHLNGDCPDSCSFLLESRKRAIARLLRIQGSVEFEKVWFELLHDLRLAMVQVSRNKKTPAAEEEIVVALGNIIENRRVKSAGLIYEYRSVNPAVQYIMDLLNNIIARYEAQPSTGFRSSLSPDLTDCLRYLYNQLKTAKEKGISFIPLISATVGSRFVASGSKTDTFLTGVTKP